MVALISINIRDATIADISRLAEIWHGAWHDAHDRIVPPELVLLRTRESFDSGLRAASTSVRVAGEVDAPLGFYALKGAELYQLFVSTSARGTGVAAALIADAETRLGQSGVHTAWLTCAIGNNRAARFYEKSGWTRAGIVIEHVEVAGGTFALNVWRYEKCLTR
jgi:GNAT superfamily N-acetyltransferase